jgi:Leucine-rich repeat (LRR) protein
MKKLLLTLLCLPFIGFGQFTLKTYVPDDNFENYLEANGMGDGIQLNDSINFWAIEMLMNLDVSNQNISDLTGIEDFTVISNLDCSNNNLTNLDLSQNSYLEDLYCSGNQLTNLDLSNNTALTLLYCSFNQLTSLDLRNGNNMNFTDGACTNNPNLYCIDVDDAAWSTVNWTVASGNIDSQQYFSNNCSGTSIQEHSINKKLLKVTDLLGRETKGIKNEPLFYIYDDGTVEKKIIIE